MPYDEPTADRVRKRFARRKQIVEKKMFGGVGFLHAGNMAVGVWREFLILRVGLDAYEAAREQPHAREFDITGRPMRGWVMLAPEGFADDADLKTWIDLAMSFVTTLPAK